MTDTGADATGGEASQPFFPRVVHVLFGVMLAIAAVAGVVNAVASHGLRARALHAGIALACIVWAVIELGYGGRPRA